MFLFEAWPFAVDFAALHASPEHHHQAAVSVVGAAGAIFREGAAEFGHGHDDDVVHAVPQVLAKGRDRIGKLAQQVRQLVVFVLVMVPAVDFGESRFDAGIGLDEAREFLEIAA